MNKIYLDNASTSFPKPETVPKAVYDYMTKIGANINRGTYEDAYSAEEVVFETREMLSELFNAGDCKNVIFTRNVTESINLLLKGFLHKGDHIICSSMEHNAVMRPLNQLEEYGIEFSRIPCDSEGNMNLDSLEGLVKSNTKAIISLHASNVCGTIMPLEKIGEFCHAHSLAFFVDCAQTAGVIDIDMQKCHIDALMFTGHKSLLGPQGIGGIILSDEIASVLTPLIVGGTGSISHTENTPTFLPDKFEAGTMNLPGIYGLNAGLNFIKETGISNIYKHELMLTELFLKGIAAINQDKEKIRIVGRNNLEHRTGVVSLQILDKDQAEMAYRLESEFGIMTRVGLHCAPNAHKTLNTYPEGTIRFSFGYFNTEEDVEAALHALKAMAK